MCISIANCYFGMGEFENGEPYFNEALENAYLLKNEMFVNRLLSEKAEILFKKKKL